ncbi:MAG: hypothetical protein DSZ11_03215, partial [Sulfurovum sp.]
KQLLKQFLLDGKKLSNLKLPKTNFVLSKIFNLFVKEAYSLKEDTYILQDSDKKDIHYEVYMKKSKKNIYYMIIDIYQDGKFTKRYQYD